MPDGVLINGKGPYRYNNTLVPDGINHETINVDTGKLFVVFLEANYVFNYAPFFFFFDCVLLIIFHLFKLFEILNGWHNVLQGKLIEFVCTMLGPQLV